MRKTLLAFLLSASAALAFGAGSSEVHAAGASVLRGALDAIENPVTRIDYYRWRRNSRCCGPRYHHRRRPVYGYYAPPPVYYVPPVVYYPPPVVYYPPPVVYGGYTVAAPYHYGGPRHYRDYAW